MPVLPSPVTESRIAGIEQPADLTASVDVESTTGEADAAARRARAETLEEAEIRWELERGALEKAMEILRADAAAQREADRVQHAVLRDALEEARLQIEGMRAHADAELESVRATHTQVLRETQSQLEAERAEAERAHAVQCAVIEDARAQLEEARADMQHVRAEAARAIEATQAESNRALTAQQEELGRWRTQLAHVQDEAWRIRTETAQAPETSRAKSDRAQQPTRRGFGWVLVVTLAIVMLAALLSLGITFRRLVGGFSVAREAAAVREPAVKVSANPAVNAPADSPRAETGHPDREPVQQRGAPLMSLSTRRGAPSTRPEPSTRPDRFVYSEEDAGVSLPVPIRQELPPWPGPDQTLQAATLINDLHLQLPSRSHGVLEILIRKDGSVGLATMQVPIRPSIDRRVTAAAKSWRYRPALKNGRPVEFKKSIQVLLR